MKQNEACWTYIKKKEKLYIFKIYIEGKEEICMNLNS